jgi:cysteine desulfurase / selenocysteine lyase
LGPLLAGGDNEGVTTSTDPVSALDVSSIRQDFPLLQRSENGLPLVYLDSAATSQKPEVVLSTLDDYYRRHNANVHRGVYRLAEEATAVYESAREVLAGFVGSTPEETIFVRNATEGINLVANAWGRANLRPGDAVLVTPMEHHSNLVPWQILAAATGAELRHAELLDDGSLDLESVATHLADGRVRLVATTYISNVLGTIVPVDTIARMAHETGALYLVDAAQAAPHLRIDVKALDVDFLVLTGHKMLGPMGIGVLYGRRAILEAMPPFLGGGEMIRRVGLDRSSWNDLPWKFEAGTPSVGDAAGLAAAVRYLDGLGLDRVAGHDAMLAGYARQRLEETSGVRVYGPRERGALVAFDIEGIHPHDLASLLDEQGIAVRAGHHCAQPLHERLGLAATTRASFYIYNDVSDVDRLVEGIGRARAVLGA